MTDQPISRRVSAIAAAKPFGLLFDFFNEFDYAERRQRPGTLDFTFGDPHDLAPDNYVEALRDSLTPQNELWFAYKQNELEAREAAASLRRVIDLPFEADDIHLTTGEFAAIALVLIQGRSPSGSASMPCSPRTAPGTPSCS